MLEWLIENEYLVQCSKYIISKLPLKRKYNIERELLLKSEFLFKKNNKLELSMNDCDSFEELAYTHYAEENNKSEDLFMEDFNKILYEKCSTDAEILHNIFYFLSTDFEVEEIAYITGYSLSKIHKFLADYKWLFSILIIQNETEQD